MTTKRRTSKHSGHQLDQDAIAAALAMAATRGVNEAAKAFNVSVRSLQRYKAAAAKDPTSELAVAVSRARQRSLRRVDDLLTATWEAVLQRLKELLPEAQITEVLRAVEVVGEHRLARKALGVTDDDAGTGQSPAAAEDAAGCEGPEGIARILPIRRAAD